MIATSCVTASIARERSNDMPVASPAIADALSRFESSIGPGLLTSKKLQPANARRLTATETRRIMRNAVMSVSSSVGLPVHPKGERERPKLRQHVILSTPDLAVRLVRGFGVQSGVLGGVEEVAAA